MNKVCEYCDTKLNTENYLQGHDGICYNEKNKQYYIYAEHFRNERVFILDVKYCPYCGRKL